MVDLVLSAAGIAVALVLVVLNGFFVASEFALVRVRETAVQSLVEEGVSGAGLLASIMDQLDDYLAVTQLGITISSLGLGWVGEPAIADLIEPLVEPVLPAAAIHLVAFAIGFGVITFLHVVFGELAPKTIAIAQAERIALLVAAPMHLFYYLFYPGIVLFNGTANFFTRQIGIPPAHASQETLTEEEVVFTLRRSAQGGEVDPTEVELIERVFDLDDIPVREAMIPRPDVVAADADATVDDLRRLIANAGHTRYPVVDAEDAGHVLGMIDAKDVLGTVDEPDTTAAELTHDLPIVPEGTPIDDVLRTLQDERVQMAGIIDEWGAFEGIVTIEDIVEELVGDIRDRFDPEEGLSSIERTDDGAIVADGAISISRLNTVIDADLHGVDYATVAGLVLDQLGRRAQVGDQVTFRGYQYDVTEVDDNRIVTVAIRASADDGDQS